MVVVLGGRGCLLGVLKQCLGLEVVACKEKNKLKPKNTNTWVRHVLESTHVIEHHGVCTSTCFQINIKNTQPHCSLFDLSSLSVFRPG